MLGFERPPINAVNRPLHRQRQLLVASAFNFLVGHACVRNVPAKLLSLRKYPDKKIQGLRRGLTLGCLRDVRHYLQLCHLRQYVKVNVCVEFLKSVKAYLSTQR